MAAIAAEGEVLLVTLLLHRREIVVVRIVQTADRRLLNELERRGGVVLRTTILGHGRPSKHAHAANKDGSEDSSDDFAHGYVSLPLVDVVVDLSNRKIGARRVGRIENRVPPPRIRPQAGPIVPSEALVVMEICTTVKTCVRASARPGPWREPGQPFSAASGTASRDAPHGRDGVILREPRLSRSLVPSQGRLDTLSWAQTAKCPLVIIHMAGSANRERRAMRHFAYR